mgnify:CR=1 FL=1
MKKFFIFLFAVFLTTLMGCQTGFGGNPEMPTSETTEEATGKTTVETNGEETFEVFALDDEDEIIANIDEINAEFNISMDDGSNLMSPFFYKNIKINSVIYTIKGLSDNNTCTIIADDINLSIDILFIDEYNECCFSDSSYFSDSDHILDFLDFREFINDNKKLICFENGTTLSFSDLYEMKK